MPDCPVTVLVADDHADRLPDVVRHLRAAGLQVGSVQEIIGVVTGTVSDDRLGALRAVPGVAAVDEVRDFQLAPPDAPLQ